MPLLKLAPRVAILPALSLPHLTPKSLVVVCVWWGVGGGDTFVLRVGVEIRKNRHRVGC